MQLCFFFLLFFFFQTEKGSALHEAALFGKVDVVRVLLETGNYHDSPWNLSWFSMGLILPKTICISGVDKGKWHLFFFSWQSPLFLTFTLNCRYVFIPCRIEPQCLGKKTDNNVYLPLLSRYFNKKL